ncbi:hypothetical protein, partial [Nonomuraea sp. NPDC003201]
MFIQVIEGRAIEADALHQALERWVRELSPGARGWLGTTAGVTDRSSRAGRSRPTLCTRRWS